MTVQPLQSLIAVECQFLHVVHLLELHPLHPPIVITEELILLHLQAPILDCIHPTLVINPGIGLQRVLGAICHHEEYIVLLALMWCLYGHRIQLEVLHLDYLIIPVVGETILHELEYALLELPTLGLLLECTEPIELIEVNFEYIEYINTS